MDDLKILAAFLLVFAAALLWHYQAQLGVKHKLPFPPSPKGDPIIGNFRSLPTNQEHIAYQKLGRELKSALAHENSLCLWPTHAAFICPLSFR